MIPNAIPFYCFRRFPNTLVEDFAYEVQRKHADEPWKRNISPQVAATIAGLLIKQSMKAQKELKEAILRREPASVIDAIREKIWVVRSNGYIRGYLTAAKGSIAAKYPNSYRRRFSEDRPIHPCSRTELIEEIESRLTEDEKVQPGIVDRIIKIGLSNGKYFKFDQRTKLYWSADAAEVNVQHRLNTRPVAARRSTNRLTDKQRIHWERFDSVPGLKHDFQNPNASELIPWVIADAAKRGETIDAAEAIKRYNAARKSSRVETDIPFKHEKGKVYGRHYYRPGRLRDMQRMLYSQFLTVTKSEEGSAPTVLLQKAIECGDVLRIWIGEDPIEGVPLFAYVGADVHAAELKGREEQERVEREAKEAEESKARTRQEKSNAALLLTKLDDQKSIESLVIRSQLPPTSTLPKSSPDERASTTVARWIVETFELGDNWGDGLLAYQKAVSMGYITVEFGENDGDIIERGMDWKPLAKAA